MKKSYLFFFFSIILISCKELYCPAFPADLNYFPYYNGQELKFVNSYQNEKQLVIFENKNSKDYSTERTDKASCSAESFFIANFNQDSLIMECGIRIGGRKNAVNHITVDCIVKKNNTYDGEYLWKFVDIPRMTPYSKIGKHISDTICLENKNNKIIKKIVILKSKGVVSYTMANGEEWKLINESKIK